jgi:hypothetical protein
MTLLRRGSGLVEWRVSFVSLFHLKDITFGEFFNIYFSCFEIIFNVESGICRSSKIALIFLVGIFFTVVLVV